MGDLPVLDPGKAVGGLLFSSKLNEIALRGRTGAFLPNGRGERSTGELNEVPMVNPEDRPDRSLITP